MITREEATKMFEEPTIEAEPNGMRRIIVPAFGFAGATDQKRAEWGPNGQFMEDVKGIAFDNPKDDATQVLKQKDGVFVLYDAPGRLDKINSYLEQNPEALKNSIRLKQFINYVKTEVVNDGGKADLWDADTAFAVSLKDAPTKDKNELKVGQTFASVKAKEVVQAVRVKEGEVFEGAEGHPQTAGKGGAYLLKDSAGMRLIQSAEFKAAYNIVKDPTQGKNNSRSQGVELG